MIALLMCVAMKIYECTSRGRCGRASPVRSERKAGRRRRSGPRPSRPRGGGQTLSALAPRKQPAGGSPPRVAPPSPQPPACAPAPPAHPTGGPDQLSNNNDADFTHENSDYQWFLDYNYRDSSCQHASVLSSLSGSYAHDRGLGGCYEELARDLDANLAEADMESFRTRDIHALLSQLPGHLMQDTNRRGEMFASVTSSLMEKFCFDSSFSPHSSSQGEESTAGSINTMSLCKSELLFSPVREGTEPATHFSVDSLDCDGLDSDIILTCRANKHNYTIAFEGSTTMYSEDSDCQEASNEKHDVELEGKYLSHPQQTDGAAGSLHRSFRLSRPTDVSMAHSDTTWSKLRSKSQLKRHPSGNNNTQACPEDGGPLRSASAPDLRNDVAANTSTQEESYSSENRLNIPIDYIKAYNNQSTNHSIGSQASEGMSSSGDSRGPNNNSRPHNFNLVKLFMKQKSVSNDGIVGLGMDNSSECWPNSSEGGDSGDSFSAESKTRAPKIPTKMNLSSDKDYQSDDCDLPQQETRKADTKSTIKKWIDNETDEYSLCAFEDSLVEGTNTAEACNRRKHDFIIEEDELSEKSEMVDESEDKNIYATVNKVAQMRFNVNNNNSFEKLGQNTGSPIRIRGNATTQTRKSISSSINSGSLSSCSESEGTQVTRMHRLLPKDMCDHKATSTQFPLDLIDKSMQTSVMSGFNSSRERVKVVEKSFLEKLKSGDSQKPVFVLYPNYTLPNLDFISKDQDMEKVFLKPLKFTPNEPNRRMQKQGEKNKRPFSCNDVEGLRRKGFNHIRDWDSLTFLLPMEYRQILAEMPEVVQQLKDKEEEILRHEEKPLFCVSPPVKHKTRPASCDCASMLSNNATNVSSSSSTATQPSSGYRGSSTMLTDSSAQNSPAPAPGFNPLFVYKYDSATSSEASFMNEKHRSGLMGAPPLPKRSISLAEQTKVAINGKVIDVAPPRPPLPKSILRKSIDKVRKNPPATTKRYSMFEMEDHMQENNITCMNIQTDQKVLKRRSLQEPYYLLKNNSIVEMKKNNDLAAKRFSQQFLDAAEKDIDDTEFFHDEGVGTESSLDSGKSHDIGNMRPPTPPLPKPHNKLSEASPYVFPTSLNYPVITNSELQQLEDFLKHSGISCNNMDEWDNNHMQKVKNQVSRFLCMKKSQDDRESLDSSCSSGHSKKSVSFAEKNEKKCGEAGLKPVEDLKAGCLSTPPNSPNMSAAAALRHYHTKNLAEIPICEEGESSPEGYASPALGHRPTSNDIAQKRALVSGVVEAVDMLVEEGNGCPRLVVGMLCPALYSLMSDGLRETIDTSFGPANNSVWHVVEASARQGPITKSLNELVMRINSEDALSESVLKFNAFIMGLLNVHSLDAFISYLRTRESVLRRHYSTTSILRGGFGVAPGGVAVGPLAPLNNALSSLANMTFSLDILWQLRDMHRSFKRMEDLMAHQSNSSGEWSEERNGGKFRRLQRRWELLSGQEGGQDGSPVHSCPTGGSTPGSAGSTPGSTSSTGRSRIPRPVTSPVRSGSNTVSPVKRCIPVPVSAVKKVSTPPGSKAPLAPLPPLPHAHSTARAGQATGAIKKTTTNTSRVSRVEGCYGGPPAPRPSSLPYRRAPPPSPSPSPATRPARRAASSDQPRQGGAKKAPPKAGTANKMVRTLWHRLPSDSGHLAFNEGERLRLVLEVDQQWLLCCRGQQKGLVPRSAVIPVPDTALQRF